MRRWEGSEVGRCEAGRNTRSEQSERSSGDPATRQISFSAAREAATVPFQVQVDLGPLDVCVVVCVFLRNACKHATTILEVPMVLELQFGSLGAVFLVFWSSRGNVKSMPKSYQNASQPAPASRPAT